MSQFGPTRTLPEDATDAPSRAAPNRLAGQLGTIVAEFTGRAPVSPASCLWADPTVRDSRTSSPAPPKSPPPQDPPPRSPSTP